MPSASQELKRNLNCTHCGKLLVKDGKVKCSRCKNEVELPASLPEDRWFCPKCCGFTLPKTLAINSKIKCRWCKRENRLTEQVEDEMTAQIVEIPRTEHFKNHLQFAIQQLRKEIQRLEGVNNDCELPTTREILEKNARALTDAKSEISKLERADGLNFDPDLIGEVLGSPLLPPSLFHEFYGFGMQTFKFQPRAENPDTEIEIEVNPWSCEVALKIMHMGSWSTYVSYDGKEKTERRKDEVCLAGKIASIKYERDGEGKKLEFLFEEKGGWLFASSHVIACKMRGPASVSASYTTRLANKRNADSGENQVAKDAIDYD